MHVCRMDRAFTSAVSSSTVLLVRLAEAAPGPSKCCSIQRDRTRVSSQLPAAVVSAHRNCSCKQWLTCSCCRRQGSLALYSPNSRSNVLCPPSPPVSCGAQGDTGPYTAGAGGGGDRVRQAGRLWQASPASTMCFEWLGDHGPLDALEGALFHSPR